MRDASALGPVIGAVSQPDEIIARLAEQQHGIVGRAQLLELGLGRRAIGHRLERGRLHLLHRGVYAVGHRVLSRDGAWMAAVLASGADAVLSHRSAGALWGVRDTAAAQVDVTVPRSQRSRAGIRVRRAVLPPDEISARHGIPVTTTPRTLLDLASILAPRQLERALEQAEALGLTDPLSLDDLMTRHHGRPGVRALRGIMDSWSVGATLTRSELEERFIAFLDGHGFARPGVNIWLETTAGWFEVDFLWRRERVVVELDGFAHHGTRAAFERDRARDRALQAAGWRVIRVTWRQLHERPTALAAELHAVLLQLSPS